jgi:predicted transcriptional regulator
MVTDVNTSCNLLQMTLEDWQCMQEHQQQMVAAAAAAKQNERSGVITLTRQGTDVSPMMASVMQQHRCVLEIWN